MLLLTHLMRWTTKTFEETYTSIPLLKIRLSVDRATLRWAATLSTVEATCSWSATASLLAHGQSKDASAARDDRARAAFLACVRAYLDAAAPFLVRAFARLIAGAPHDLNRVIEDARAALAPIVDSEL